MPLSSPTPGTHSELQIWGASDVGCVRSENQDAFLVLRPSPEPDSTPLRLTGEEGFPAGGDACRVPTGPEGVFLIVCDGMGGARGGGQASHLAVEGVEEALKAGRPARHAAGPAGDHGPDEPADLLRFAVERANRRVWERSLHDPALHGMGTTATVAGIVGRTLHVGHVGDSRAYVVRGGQARQLTRDQTVAQELLDRGSLAPGEVETSPHRHVLTQALGTVRDVRVALSREELVPGDWVLVCSDGLSGVVTPEEMADALDRHEAPGPACRELLTVSLDRGAPDNVTLIVARLMTPGGNP